MPKNIYGSIVPTELQNTVSTLQTTVSTISDHFIEWSASNVSSSFDEFLSRTTSTVGYPVRYRFRNNATLQGGQLLVDSESSTWTTGSLEISVYKGGATANSGSLLHTWTISKGDLTLLNNGEMDDNTTAWNEWVYDLSTADLSDAITAGEHISVRVNGNTINGSGIELVVAIYYTRQA